MDGKERMIVVEGLAEGAMQHIAGIALQALTGALAQPAGTCRRAVHWHKDLRHAQQTLQVLNVMHLSCHRLEDIASLV